MPKHYITYYSHINTKETLNTKKKIRPKNFRFSSCLCLSKFTRMHSNLICPTGANTYSGNIENLIIFSLFLHKGTLILY